jgi:hypothetical protein
MLHIKFFTKILKSTQINRVVKVNSSLCILPGRQYNKAKIVREKSQNEK